jgi:hypothetical protein
MENVLLEKQMEEIINEPEDIEDSYDQPLSNAAIQSGWRFINFVKESGVDFPVLFRYNSLVVAQWETRAFKITENGDLIEWGTQKVYHLNSSSQLRDILNMND